jgi:CRISPR/Cas system-associated protein Csm6
MKNAMTLNQIADQLIEAARRLSLKEREQLGQELLKRLREPVGTRRKQ